MLSSKPTPLAPSRFSNKLAPIEMEEPSSCKWCGYLKTSQNSGLTLRSSFIGMGENTSMCLVCSIFCAGIREYITNTSIPIPGDLDHIVISLDSSVTIWLVGTTVRLTFFCSKRTHWILQTLPWLGPEKQVPKTTSSDESFSWVVQQINNCRDSHHQDCISYSSAPVFPKRVVFVGTVTEPALRLYESQGESDPYVCLSYCWGHRPFLRTLVNNIESHKISIEPSHLPSTINHAIDYTRRLGVQYIWIDSLCIIQDSLDDWREEAGKMASIFHNSFLVLSATRSTDAYGGLYASFPSDFETFAVRVDTETNQVLTSEGVDTETTSSKIETIYVRRGFSHVQVGSSSRWLNFTPLLPTLSRGWIFQERFLSPRVLHFGPQELYFECLQDSACQCMHDNIDQRLGWTWERHDPRTQLDIRQQSPKAYYGPSLWQRMDHYGLVITWHELVHDYTKLELTYEKDLFPAISGLAREMSIARAAAREADGDTAQGTEYFAGLWKDSLVRDLCWQIDSSSQLNLALGSTGNVTTVERIKSWQERPREWRAPTWSWGSVNASVKSVAGVCPVEYFTPLCEVLDISCTAAGSDEMGELTGGTLVLRGQVLPAKVIPSPFFTGREALPWQLLALDIEGMDESFVQEVCVDDGCQDLMRLYDEGQVGGGDGPTVYCFLLAKTDQGDQGTVIFLLLKNLLLKVEGESGPESGPESSQDVYQRFGTLQLTEPPRRRFAPKLEWEERFSVLAHAKEEVVMII